MIGTEHTKAAQVVALQAARDIHRGYKLANDFEDIVRSADLGQPGWLVLHQHIALLNDELLTRITQMDEAAAA